MLENEERTLTILSKSCNFSPSRRMKYLFLNVAIFREKSRSLNESVCANILTHSTVMSCSLKYIKDNKT